MNTKPRRQHVPADHVWLVPLTTSASVGLHMAKRNTGWQPCPETPPPDLLSN